LHAYVDCVTRCIIAQQRLLFSQAPNFIFNDTVPPEIYSLSLHDALPISEQIFAQAQEHFAEPAQAGVRVLLTAGPTREGLDPVRSEEHTSELQSRENLVCRLLLEKKNEKQLWGRQAMLD